MTKYIAYKVFETNGKEEHLDEKIRALELRNMAVIHEDYYEGVIKAELEQLGKCEYCGGDALEEPHYDCIAEHNMIARKESIADMEEAMGGAQEDYDD